MVCRAQRSEQASRGMKAPTSRPSYLLTILRPTHFRIFRTYLSRYCTCTVAFTLNCHQISNLWCQTPNRHPRPRLASSSPHGSASCAPKFSLVDVASRLPRCGAQIGMLGPDARYRCQAQMPDADAQMPGTDARCSLRPSRSPFGFQPSH